MDEIEIVEGANFPGFIISNSIMGFYQLRHPLLEVYFKMIVQVFNGNSRTNIGPPRVKKSLQQLCKRSDIEGLKYGADKSIRFHCGNITLVGAHVASPVQPGLKEKYRLFRQHKIKTYIWKKKVLRNSVAVHTYSSTTHNLRVTGDPRKDIYSFLGPNYCPVSFTIAKDFVSLYKF